MNGRKGFYDLISDPQIRYSNFWDWIYPYPFILKVVARFASLGGAGSNFIISLITYTLFIFVIWPVTNLFWKFGWTYIAIVIRLISGKGGWEGQKINLMFLLGYTAIIVGVIVAFVLPHILGYYTYTHFFQDIKLI